MSAQVPHVPFDFFGGFSSGHLAHLSRVRATAGCPLSRRLWEGALHLAIVMGLVVGTITVAQNHRQFMKNRVAVEDVQRKTPPEPGCELICEGDQPIGLTFSQRFGIPVPKAPQVVVAQETPADDTAYLSTAGPNPDRDATDEAPEAAEDPGHTPGFENEFSLESERTPRRPHGGLTE